MRLRSVGRGIGFRASEVPEHATLVLLIVGAGSVVFRRMRVAVDGGGC